MTRESKKSLAEVREGLKEIDIYMGMLQKKGRSVHAEGGRIEYAGGGKAGLLRLRRDCLNLVCNNLKCL